MSAAATTISFRAPATKKALIDEAANALGKNRTEFILETLSARAHEVLTDRTQFRLSPQQLLEFDRILEQPVNLSAVRMLAKGAPWE